MLFDTTYLIHLSGQRERPKQKRATDKIALLNSPTFTSRICCSELAEGFADSAPVDSYLEDFTVLEIDAQIA